MEISFSYTLCWRHTGFARVRRASGRTTTAPAAGPYPSLAL